MSTATRLFDYIYNQRDTYPMEKSMARRDSSGEWLYFSTGEIIDLAEKAAQGLLALGLQKGEKVAIVSYKNRPEWFIMDVAVQMAGGVSVPLYPTISPNEYVFILNNAEARFAFCGQGDLFEKLKEAQKSVESLTHIFAFDKDTDAPHWEDMFSSDHKDKMEEIKAAAQADDLVTIIYTSGTTGNPKGVMLTHTNIGHVIQATKFMLPEIAGVNVLSFLPLCHIFERTVVYSLVFKKLSIHFTGTDNLPGETGDLQTVKPHFFTTVPRLLEKVYEGIYNRGLSLSGTTKKLFFWALGLTESYDLHKKPGFFDGIQWNIADKLIFSKWRAALGGNVKLIITGAAPCPEKIARVFTAAGIPIREGYGLTETSPTLTVNHLEPSGAQFGTVGMAIDGVELLIDNTDGTYEDDEGEILAYGPNVMQGYYNNPEANAKVFKEIEGKRWFKTGDIGKMVLGPNGGHFLKITDRKKELLKTSGGKYVAPAPIENRFRESFFVEQIMIIGDKRKFVSALIVPALEPLKKWYDEHDMEWTNLKDATKNTEVLAHYQNIVDEMNPEFSHIEQIKKFSLVPQEWLPTHEDGSKAELTPTMKLKRRVILEKFHDIIEEIYN
ncbi:MAG: long-chain fatty acid--CoA ligase [Bacteroidia bacterium]|nr:long-chain fatty acid--CoA ligase [Bacteroidia bacterium]